MNKRYLRWYKRQIPKKIKHEMLAFQAKNHYYPDASIFNGGYLTTYNVPADIHAMRQHDRDLMIMSDAVGDHNYSAITRMWSAENMFMIFYFMSPKLFLGVLSFLAYWCGGVFVAWAFELIVGSKVVILFMLWIWGFIATKKWITLFEIVELEFDCTRFDFATKTGRLEWRKEFGQKVYDKIMGSIRLHLTLFNKWVGVAIVVLGIIYLSETDIHPDRFRVIDWACGWFFALLHISWILLFKLIPLYIIQGFEWLF